MRAWPCPRWCRSAARTRLPLSFAQQRLWFLAQLEPGSAEYNVPVPVRMPGAADVQALGAALAAVTRRHEVLRTRLVAGADGVPYQVIDPPAPFRLPVADVSGAADPRRAAGALLAADAAAPFDLAAGPVIRACLARLAADEHMLVLSVHHAAFDEWSEGVFKRELAALYQAARSGEPDRLPPLGVQYADFAAWQRGWLTTEVLDGQLAYWRGQLAGAPVLELPADRPRPPVRSTAGAETGFAVPARTARGLREVAQHGGASMFMTVLAALMVLLGRYTGLDDVVVGTPVANRDRAETEDLIGFFVNTLVMRADLSGDPSFTELLGRVRAMALGAYAHQDLPFEQLVDELVTERDRSRTPLFQVMFTWLAAGRDGERAGRGGERPGAAAAGAGPVLPVKFDLTVTLRDIPGGGLAGALEYGTALFDAATVGRLAGHLGVLLAGVAADPAARLSGLPVLTSGEREQVLAGWNDTAALVPDAGGVHELITGRAAACPDAVAVVAGDACLTYRGLAGRAGRLAGFLRQQGAGPESVVGLCLGRGADMVAAVLAAWLAGAAYLPLDPAYPAARLGFMLADSRARLLVTDRAGRLAGLEEYLPAGVAVVRLDDPVVRARIAAAPPAVPVPVVAGQLAYVIYTSGSTGTPKGVQVGHGSVVDLVAGVGLVLGAGAGCRVLQFSSFSFDAAVLEVAPTLAGGGVLVVAGGADRAEPGRLAGLVAAAGVQVACITPSLLAVLDPGQLAGLGTLVAIGERLDGAVAAVWGAGRRLLNGYGPTETTVLCCTGVAGPEAGLVPPIGPPMANTRAYVLDRYLSPVPAGVAGELFIGGAGVARGYGYRPALTAERFVADRFGGDGGRLYRTGDLARWRPDGQLEYLGRIDQQVKVRGFRVELGEVEAVLAAHPAIAAAAVAVAGEQDQARLAAWLVPASPAAGIPAADELRAFVAGRLPEFMIPAAFTELAALPLTPNGKLDRAALPAPGTGRPETGETYVPPRGATEELLAGIWAQVLGLDRAGAQDNFFALGGHSLLVTRVISRVREVFGTEVPLAALFDHPTVAGLAAVDRGHWCGPGGAAGGPGAPRPAAAVVVRAAAAVVRRSAGARLDGVQRAVAAAAAGGGGRGGTGRCAVGDHGAA